MTMLAGSTNGFNSYAEKGCNRNALLLRGFRYGDDSTNIDPISGKLMEAGIAGIESITRFRSGHMKRNPDSTFAPIHKIVPAHGTALESFANIKQICNFSIRIEKMKPSTIIQCHRCQRFAHTASLCAHQFRCVKRVEQHSPGQCPRNKNPTTPPACINCRTAGLQFEGHTANDVRKCAYYNSLKTSGSNTPPGSDSDKRNKNSSGNALASSSTCSSSTNQSPNGATSSSIIEPVRANPATNRGSSTSERKPKTGRKKSATSKMVLPLRPLLRPPMELMTLNRL